MLSANRTTGEMENYEPVPSSRIKFPYPREEEVGHPTLTAAQRVLSPRRPGLQGGLAAARHCRGLLRPQTPPPAPWRPGPPPGRRHGPPPAVGGRVRAASEGPVLATRGPPRRELGRALLIVSVCWLCTVSWGQGSQKRTVVIFVMIP